MPRAGGAFLLLLGCLACRSDSRAPIRVYDGFEGPALSGIWDRSRLEPGAVVIQSQVVRAGRGAACIVLRPGDRFERGVRGDGTPRPATAVRAASISRWASTAT